MRTRAVLPYLAALLLLAWILGTLSRSGTGGTSILSGSYWLVYLVYLVPVFAVSAMLVILVFLVINWKLLSDVLGFGMAQHKKQTRKQSSLIRLMVWGGFWAIALATLYYRCGGIFCSRENNRTLTQMVQNATGVGQGLVLPSLATPPGLMNVFVSFVGSPWFTVPFLGILVVSTLILARGFAVSLEETRAGRIIPVVVREEGKLAVQEALRVLKMEQEADPRTRIIICYERMIRAAASLGASVSVDQTARELERGIRRTFRLQGRGIADLTKLFEEARYSLHEITGGDSELAQDCLREIGEELGSSSTVEN